TTKDKNRDIPSLRAKPGLLRTRSSCWRTACPFGSSDEIGRGIPLIFNGVQAYPTVLQRQQACPLGRFAAWYRPTEAAAVHSGNGVCDCDCRNRLSGGSR